MKLRTTAFFAIVIALTLAGAAAAQTVTASLLDDLSRYLGAAARLTARVIAGVDAAAQPGQIPTDRREEALQEIGQISREIALLRAAQSHLVFDLGDYVTKVRANVLDADQRQRAWRSILSGIDNVAPIVQTTLEVVERSAWLKVALTESDRATLRQVLMGRSSLLMRLGALEAPSTPEQIDKLDGMTQFYRQLMASLHQLDASLIRATDRLKGH